MQIDAPSWRLRQNCPRCHQRDLLLVRCPGCSHLAALCTEEGEGGPAFPDPRNLHTVRDDRALCPTCSEFPFSAFVLADAALIRANGLDVSEYE